VKPRISFLTTFLQIAILAIMSSTGLNGVKHHSAIVQPAKLKLIFQDNFSGNQLNLNNWFEYDGAGNASIGLRRPSAVSVSNGMLDITAREENGQIVSEGIQMKQGIIHGQFEARVRTTVDPSHLVSGEVIAWPQSNIWPEGVEMDMYETGLKGRSTFNSTLHWGSVSSSSPGGSVAWWTSPVVNDTKWHMIRLDWTAHALSFYVDNMLVGRDTNKLNPGSIPSNLHRLCLQLDPWINGTLKEPVHEYVDWVKVWDYS
jgi:hypothetical protein